MAAPTEARHTSIKAFVDPKVQTIPVTDDIIKKIYTYFPQSAKVISGYLSEEQLYWKVNYHWELLLEALDHCSGLDIDKKHKDALAAIKATLNTNVPNPASGYRKSPLPGEPKDKSSHEVILQRHALVRQGKIDFKAVVDAADIFKNSKRDPKALMLAYAPVARPAQGKHSTGYALDIEGNNADIKVIAKSLGAVKPFDEGSHVHCEWPNGVDTSAQGGTDSAQAAQRAVKMGIDNKVVVSRHCLLRTA
jgi:hypothetical protein